MSLSKTNLKTFLCTKMHCGELEEFNGETALFSTGFLDSLQLIDLVSYIETEASMRIKPMEVSLHNLDSIDKILLFIEKKQAPILSD